MNKLNLSEYLADNYFEYGNFINFNRVMCGVDGLKPVQRRILLAMKNLCSGKRVSTVNAIGAAQALHPFGDASIEGVLADLARLGTIDSEGDFGIKLIESIPAAAPRYTKVGLTKNQVQAYFSLLNYAPEVEGEEQIEPAFLVVPVPFSLVFGTLSWGLGTISRTPAFTPDSLVAAYRANDPSLLQSSYGYEINHKASELKDLWETGRGRVALNYKVTRPNADTIVMIGSGELFTPNLSKFNELIQQGQIIISHESSDNVQIRISRISGARKVDMNEVYQTAVSIASNKKLYEIKLVLNGKIIRLGIRDWLQVSMNLYEDAFNKSKTDRIAKLEFDIELYTHLTNIGKEIIAGLSDAEIIKKLGISPEILEAALKKSINQLRRTSFESEVNSLKAKIKEIQVETVNAAISNYVTEIK